MKVLVLALLSTSVLSFQTVHASTQLSVNDRFGHSYSLTINGEISDHDMQTVRTDLEALGQQLIPVDQPLYQEGFGTESKTYLEWFSKRIRYFKLKDKPGKVLGEYLKHGFFPFKKSKSVTFDPAIFKLEPTLRRSLLIHEAFHYDLPHHASCKPPSKIVVGKKSCDEFWRASYGIQFLYLSDQLDLMSNESNASWALTDLMSYLDRILDSDSRSQLIHNFQKQLTGLSSVDRSYYQSAIDSHENSKTTNPAYLDQVLHHIPDISELFKP